MSHPLRSSLITAARTDLPTFVHRAIQTVCPGIPFQANWHVDPLAFTGSGHDDQFDSASRFLPGSTAARAFAGWVG